MLNIVQRAGIKSFVSLLIVALLLSLAQTATASDTSDKKAKESRATGSDKAVEPAPVQASSPEGSNASNPPMIASIIFSDAMKAQPDGAETLVPANPGPLPAPPPPRASTAPMTAGEKFNLAMKSAFAPPGPYAQSLFTGLFNELLDNNGPKDDDFSNFMGDAIARAGRSFGTRITNSFFEKFAYATIFKQDPRYHRSNKKSTGGKIGYAVSRLFITQGDRSGDQPNISFLLGGLTSAAISNAWQHEENQTVRKTLSRWSTHLWLTALTNILREYLSGQ